jgi:hypothetical protein
VPVRVMPAPRDAPRTPNLLSNTLPSPFFADFEVVLGVRVWVVVLFWIFSLDRVLLLVNVCASEMVKILVSRII